MKTLKEKIEVMQAALDGKEIYFIPEPHQWTDCWNELANPKEADYDWGRFDYRIKPEPLEFWVNVNESTILSVHDTEDSARGAGYSQFKTIKMREVTDE